MVSAEAFAGGIYTPQVPASFHQGGRTQRSISPYLHTLFIRVAYPPDNKYALAFCNSSIGLLWNQTNQEF